MRRIWKAILGRDEEEGAGKTGLPNFLIVGAQRCGTTAMHGYLRSHPEIFMPELKEPRFFVRHLLDEIDPEGPGYENGLRTWVRELEAYVALFGGAESFKARGEASPQYLAHAAAVIPEIKVLLGDVSIIMLLRDPVERALSAYRFLKTRIPTVPSLGELLDEDGGYFRRRLPFFDIVGNSRYEEGVGLFMEAFPKVKVWSYEALSRDAATVAEEVCAFLGVEAGRMSADFHRVNETDKTLTEDVDESVLERLRASLAGEVEGVRKCLGMALSEWKI